MKTDIAFSSDDSHNFLPWLIGLMVALAALLLCFVVTINSWVIERHGDYTNNITVNIPVIDGEHPPSEETITRITNILQQASGVESVTRVEQKQLQKMLVPWLGENMANAELPLPIVLDIALNNNVTVDIPKLQEALTNIVEGAEVDTHEAWVAAFISFSTSIRAVITLFAVLILLSIGLMIAFTSRASLRLHSKTVNLLHSVGAEDRYISRQFQQEACALTMRGAISGCVISAIGFWGMGLYMHSLGNTSIPSLDMSQEHIILLVGVAIACGLVAWSTAKFCVMKQLKQML
ncbi:MAG: FtsX-like permease family protein [Rickettsiales bacterium]|jgi:cell division transport system permease protein